MSDKLFEVIRDVLTFLAAIGGAWLTVRGTKKSDTNSRQVADRVNAEIERENNYNQLQEDLAATRSTLRDREGDIRTLRDDYDKLYKLVRDEREQHEAQIRDILTTHARREQQLVAYIVSIGGNPPVSPQLEATP